MVIIGLYFLVYSCVCVVSQSTMDNDPSYWISVANDPNGYGWQLILQYIQISDLDVMEDADHPILAFLSVIAFAIQHGIAILAVAG